MGLFSDMGKFGLAEYENTNVLDKDSSKVSQKSEVVQEDIKKSSEEIEKEVLFDKHYTCPVCDRAFVAKSIRAGRIRIKDKDTDLRPIYEDVDPLKYDVITCTNCGYSSVSRYFGKLSTRQMKDIMEQIGSHFSGLDSNVVLYSYDEAITRYKLALLNSVVKKAKNGERAYTAMKLAWILRGKRQSLKSDDPSVKQLYEDELECLTNAYEGFTDAISNEPFPIAGMNEPTLEYVLADLARRLKRYEDAARILGRVIVSKQTPPRLKEQALTLKEMLKEEMKKAE